jgi:hypothetical protein
MNFSMKMLVDDRWAWTPAASRVEDDSRRRLTRARDSVALERRLLRRCNYLFVLRRNGPIQI